MTKPYRVYFTGYMLIEAEDPDEAEELMEDGCFDIEDSYELHITKVEPHYPNEVEEADVEVEDEDEDVEI